MALLLSLKCDMILYHIRACRGLAAHHGKASHEARWCAAQVHDQGAEAQPGAGQRLDRLKWQLAHFLHVQTSRTAESTHNM